MTGGVQTVAAILIALAVVGGVFRLILSPRRGPAWRRPALVVLQAASGGLLYLTLFPPPGADTPGRLVVATRGAKPEPRAPGDVLVALPEAGALSGAIRAPDLGSALRLNPEPGALRLLGDGLVPRDRIPLDRPTTFAPSPPPHGLVALTLPAPVAPGARFTVTGEVGDTATVELLDPAGAVVDRAAVPAHGRFQVSAATRAPGLALFELRLNPTTEHIDIPVETRAQRSARVLVLAGAPGAETKHLRRWAQDAGLALSVEIAVGDGVVLGDPPTPITREGLNAIDLVVIDDRRWEGLSASARAALDGATRAGLGLLLRPTGPLSAATRRDWASLGAPVLSDGEREAFRLAGPAPLELTRYAMVKADRGGVPAIRDQAGAPLAVWRPRGQGRVGLWTVADSYGLVQMGHADRFGELWSALFSVLARPGEGDGPRLEGVARPGRRAVLCGVSKPMRIVDPRGVESRLVPDPDGCAAYWPRVAGWSRIVGSGAIYVHTADAAPSLTLAEDRQAAIDAAAAGPSRGDARARATPGSPWPWAVGLLLALPLLWWLERRSPLKD